MKKLLLLQNLSVWKNYLYLKYFDSKIDLVEKLLRLKNYSDSKIDWMEKLLTLKNCLDGKIICIEKLLEFKN